jgi:tetratricopeptide (TPR) repeat protein
VVAAGDRLFDYSSARNYAASLASNDMVAMPDCDEAYTVLDLDAIESAIRTGNTQLEYHFVFSHDEHGNPAIQFRHSKFYDRRLLRWTGVVHEVLQGEAQRLYTDAIRLEHWQQPQEHRSRYLTGLAYDCYLHPANDRNSHYFGRELLWAGRPKSAIRELRRHIAMGKWVTERAQSLVYIGDAWLMLGDEGAAVERWHEAFSMDGSRREPLMRLAEHYWRKGDHQKTACYAAAALEIPWSDFYANRASHYRELPHELLYWAKWYLGDRQGAANHWGKALEFCPERQKFLHDRQFFEAA